MRRSAVCRDTDRETEITRHLNALQDINMGTGTIAAANVLKEVICDYFVNRDLSDGELSESDTDSNDNESADRERGVIPGTCSDVNITHVDQEVEEGEFNYCSDYNYYVLWY